jgi:HAD superfamily hydrolase (TIGR01490 family)
MRATDERPQIAAFFDIDGTLLGPPSLERRFFTRLTSENAIPAENYFLWLAQAVELLPKGIAMIQHANKMYLRGVAIAEGDREGPWCGGQLRTAAALCPEAFRRMAWHAGQEHAIVLVTGTLAPLANRVARELERRIAACGDCVTIDVRATLLEEMDGRWTGRLAGEAMFGEAKAQAMRRMALERKWDLGHCYAYGDSVSDRWMLHIVGRPAAVNPSADLERIARRRGWPVLWWREQRRESPQSSQSSERRAEATMGLGFRDE